MKEGDRSCRSAGRRLPGKEIARSGKTNTRSVEERGREDMCFFNACNLLAQARRVRHERIDRGGGLVRAIVHGIDHADRVLVGEDMIDSRGAKIFADRL